MKKTLTALTFLALLSSCSSKYTPASSVMINVTDYEIGNTSLLKTGEACSTSIMGITGSDSSTSIIDAMKNGGISKIKMVDRRTVISLFSYKDCIVVHGL